VIEAVAAAAGGDRQARAGLEPVLAELGKIEAWAALVGTLRRLLDGERDPALLDGLDPIDTAIVRATLDRLGATPGAGSDQ
jgi:hypothetical protein